MKKALFINFLAALVMLAITAQPIMAQSGWEQVFTVNDVFLRDICFVEGSDGLWNTGWAISFEGGIYKTTDGGDTWATYTQTYSNQLGGIFFVDETTGYISTLNGKVLKSVDGGVTWSVSLNVGGGFDKVAFNDANNGCVIGGAKYYTTDGGTTWTAGSGGSNYWDLDHASGDTFYAISLGGALGQSTDGGATWSDVESLGKMGFMTKFMDDMNGMFGGDLSYIKVTHDGGATWIASTLGGGQDAINTGGFFDADTIYADGSSGDIFKTTDGGNTWDTDTSFSSSVLAPRGMAVTAMDLIFVAGNNSSGQGVIWRKAGYPTIIPDFTAGDTVVCAGSSVDFTDLSVGNIDSWSWEFEGGTPSTSTDQNPTVTYSSPGIFDVKLVVSVGANSDSLTKTGYIEVDELPNQANTPAGDDTVCTGMIYYYTTNAVQYAHSYDWELDPSNAGTITWEDTLATLTVADSWTGDFTLRVRAGNVCGDGSWSGYFEGTVFQSPSVYTVEGGGSYCLDGDGVEITLNGSDTGISYELYKDGAPTGNTVDGTGSGISFGLITDEGYYTVYGSNGNCTQLMDDQVQVIILYPPLEPGDPTGPDTVCNNETSDYTSTGSDDADSYVWTLSPEDAGTITGNGLSATVEWSSTFSGTASVEIAGVNDCGQGNPSVLDVEVGAIPVPVISGENEVCDNTSEDYTTDDNEGSTYTWEVTGGTIADGQGTSAVTVDWGEPGEGSVSVNEESAAGCSGSSDEFLVTIDNCTGVTETIDDYKVTVYPNPAHHQLNIDFKSTTAGTSEITVYNRIGQLMLKKTVQLVSGKQKVNIDLSHLQSGLYTLKIQTENSGVITRQFVKN